MTVFRIFHGKDDKVYWRLKDNDGEPIITGPPCSSKPDALMAIARVVNSSQTAITKKISANDKLFFQIRNKSSRRMLAWSQLHQTEESLNAAIEKVIEASKNPIIQ